MTNVHDDTPDQYKTSSPEKVDSQGSELLRQLSNLQREIHQIALDHGFWEDHERISDIVSDSVHCEDGLISSLIIDTREQVIKTMLVVTELSEATEALRHGNPPDDMLVEFDSFSVELADAVIRILDIAARFDLPLVKAMIAKVKYNKSRLHKHGKSM